MDNSQLYFFIATCVASIFGFVLAFILNRFVNKMDQKFDHYDRLFESIQKIIAVHEVEIEHLKDDKYPVRYDKKK